MPFISFIAFMREKMWTFFLGGLFIAAVSFFVLTWTARRFETTTDFMVVQTTTQTQDFYTQFKSSEYLGKVLGEGIYSERFINAIVETGKVNKEFLPFDKKDKLEAWRKMVSVDNNIDLGMLHVAVKSDSDREAGRIMDGLTDVLIHQNMLFRGGDEKSVEVRVLSGPITERNPSFKEIMTVVITAFIAGFLLTALTTHMRRALARERMSLSIPRDMLGHTR